MSILLIEDDADAQRSIGHVLRDEGYVVHAVSDGIAALDFLERHGPPSLILLDLMLPRMNGQVLCSHLVADEKLSRIPVVLISAHPDLRAIARDLNATDFVTKPLSIEELLLVVQNSSRTVTRIEHNLRGAFRRLL